MWYLHWPFALWATVALEVAADVALVIAVLAWHRHARRRVDEWWEGGE